MSAKEQLDKAMIELKKMKPYLDKTVAVVKSTSVKVGETAIPLIKKGYFRAKTEIDSQIKKYKENKDHKDQPPKV